MNWSAILQGVRYAATHRLTKGGGMALLVTGGLKAAILAGIAVPSWAMLAGPVVGTLLYSVLPTKEQQEIDLVAEKVVDVATTIPQTYQEYPTGKNGQTESASINSDINKG